MTERGPENLQPGWEQIEQDIRLLGQLHGIDNFRVVTQPGAGWSCAKTSQGLVITIDPEQSAHGAGEQAAIQETDTPADIMTLFIGGHELGHARDMLDADFAGQPRAAERSPARDFFDCLIDDTVIDYRNRRLPRLSNHADKIYAFQMPHNLSAMPKHVQLMYAARVSTVVTNPQLVMDETVRQSLGELTSYQQGDKNFNIPAILADPQTTLKDRRQIADQFIWPAYQAFLEEDRQTNDDFGDAYGQYQQAVHGHQQGDAANGDSKPQSLGEQIAQAILETRQETDIAKEQAKAKRQEDAATAKQRAKAARAQALSKVITTEMSLMPEEARQYAESLLDEAAVIQDIADVFLQLAAPTETKQSPRYANRARAEGQRLHPARLDQAALQQQSGIEQRTMQPVTRKANRKVLDFGGLDFELLFDVSGSMRYNGKCQGAAATGLALMEGLQLAREQAARANNTYAQPDIRTQIITFAEDIKADYPLSYQPTSSQKGAVYHQLLNPYSDSTYISSSLDIVHNHAVANPQRNTLAVVVSDGVFHDQLGAKARVEAMPLSAYVVHLVIGQDATEFISKHHQRVPDPKALPAVLHSVLAGYIRRNQ